MKHPALTRVFAIVLAVMCAVMLLAGISGLRSAFSDRSEEKGALELMVNRIESARALEDMLARSESYEKQLSSLEESKAQHEEAAAQHRTDLATYSATRGGTKMGADKLWDAKTQAENGRAQLEAGLAQINGGLAQVAVAEKALSNLKSTADNLSTACGTYAAECGAASNIAYAAIANPSTDPDIIAANEKAVADAMPGAGVYGATRDDCVSFLGQLAAANGETFDASAIPAVGVSVNMSDAQNIQNTLTQIGTAKAVFEQLGGAVMTPWNTLAATRAQLETAKATADDAMTKLEAGESEIQWNLELIWYQNGELEKDALKLEAERARLEQEAKELADRELVVEERKENERKYTSLSILLKTNDNVADAVDAGENMLNAAEQEAARLKAESTETFAFRLIICALSLIGAILGFIVIPAAFERWKSRILLLLPAVICFAFAAASLALNLYLGRGMLYSVLFVLPFALFYLLSAAPKEKARG